MTVEYERKAQILGCAVEILRDQQQLVDDDVRAELVRIADRIEDIARLIDCEG